MVIRNGQIMEMNNKIEDISLSEDKDLANALFGKEALANFEANNKLVEADYFDQQVAIILKATKNKKAPVFKMGNFSKLAIAASLLTMVATTYLYLQKNKESQTVPAYVKIEEIPDAEIENYLNSNEELAEIDWQTQINNEAENLETLDLNLPANKDSNKLE